MRHTTVRRYQIMTLITLSYGAVLFIGYALASLFPNSTFAAWIEDVAPFLWFINGVIYGYVVATVIATIVDERYDERRKSA